MSTFFVNGPSSFAVRGRSFGPGIPDPVAPAPRRARRWPAIALGLFILALAAWHLGGAKAALAPHLVASASRGHVDGTALPGAPGDRIVVAHRDTHFAFLRYLCQDEEDEEDEETDVENLRERVRSYRVREATIVDEPGARVLDAADSPQLPPIPCWPFDAAQPGPVQRYVMIADRIGV